MREVEFLLTAKADPQAQQTIRQFGQSIAEAQQGIRGGATETLGAQATRDLVASQKLQVTLATKHQSEIKRLMEQGFIAEQDFGQKRIEAANRIAAAIARVEQEQATQAGASKQALDELKASIQGGAKVAIEQEAAIQEARQRSRQQQKAATEDERAERQRIAVEQRSAAKQQRADLQAAVAAQKASAAASQQAQRIQTQSLQEYSRQLGTAQGSGREILQTFGETSESVMKLARGFVFFGLTGETELQKVQDALLTMQGTIDLTVGGTKLLLGMEKAMRLFNTATVAATAAQEALNVARMRGASIAAVEGVGQLTGLGGAVARGGAAMMSGAGSVAAMGARVGMAGVGGTAATTLGAGLAAAAGAAFGLVSAFQTAQEAIEFGVGGGARAGGFVETIGTSRFNPFSDMVAGGQLAAERGRGKALDEQLMKLRQLRAIQEADDQAKNQAQSELNERLRAQYDLTARIWEQQREGLSDQERLKSIQREMASLESASLQGSQAARERRFSLLQQELGMTQRIAQAEQQAAQESIRMNQEALRTVEQRIQAEEESTQSAIVRFGLMDEAQQSEIVMLRQRLSAGQQLSAQELGRLRGLSQEIDAEIELQAIQRARAGGVGALGIEQASGRRVSALEQMRESLAIEVESAIDYEVQITSNAEQVAQRISRDIQAGIGRDIQTINARVQELTADITKIQIRQTVRANGG